MKPNVVSSGAIIPARAPPSIDILQTVMRPSIESARIASPEYSTTRLVPPAMPIFPMIARIMSFAETPFVRIPLTTICIVLEAYWERHCVASTCSTSLVPIPKANVPNAPCVEVWLSPQTIVCPGCVMPSSGPMTCTMPWLWLNISNRVMPDSRQLRSRAENCPAASASRMGRWRFSVPTKNRHLPILDADAAGQFSALERNCRESGITLFDMFSHNQGIVHVIGPELGITQPGQTIVCGDSHTSTHGAFGTLAFGIGTSEVEHVLATQCLSQSRSKTLHIVVNGKRPKGVTAKDIILAIIGKIGIGGGTGHVAEYGGEAMRSLSMDGRMTV